MSGVRSSWDMFREELRLVLRRERQLLSFFFERLARLLDFLVLALDLGVLLRESPHFSSSCWLVLLELELLALQFARERLRLLEEFSVRVLASIVLSTMPIDSMSWSRNAWWVGLNPSNVASSRTALT